MIDRQPLPQALGCEFAGGVARQTKGIGDGLAEEGVAQCTQHDAKGASSHLVILVPDAELGDEGLQGFEDRVQRIAIAGEDHPGGERTGAFAPKGVKGLVDDIAGVGLAPAGPLNGSGDPRGDRVRDGPGKRALQPRRRAEMVEQVGVSAADLGSHGLQGDGLRSTFEQKPARRVNRGGTAFFRAKAGSSY